VVVIAGMLAGCVDDLGTRISGRWGPNPEIQPAAFNAIGQNQYLVLSYLARASGRGLVTQDGVLLMGTPADWYEVAQWGFNIGRQDCEIYLDNLFRMNRERGRNDSIMTAVSTAAAFIVAATTKSQTPLSVIAAVFGLSIAANDAIFDSYLFSQAAPGLVFKKVNDLQEEFRSKVTTADVYSPSSAYNAIQTYYHICLPHAIEGVLLQKIADSGPVIPDQPIDKPLLGGAPPTVQLQRFRQGSGSRNSGLRAPELR
jgi:hypothetical protein